jgi:hypothetical protein
VDVLNFHPETALTYGKVVFHMPDRQSKVLGGPFDLKAIARGNYIGNASVLVRKSTLDQVGFYDPHVILKRVCDWDLWIRIGKRFPVLFVDKEFADEYGEARPNSIGNTFTYFADIISKYMRCDRNSLLQPKAIESYDSFSINPFGIFSPKEREQIRFLVLEHLVSTIDLERLRRLASTRRRVSSQLCVNNPSYRRTKTPNPDVSTVITNLIDYYEEKMTMIKLENIQLRGLHVELDKSIRARQKELETIQVSFIYRNMRSIAKKVDTILPNGTTRGRIRQKLTSRLAQKAPG